MTPFPLPAKHLCSRSRRTQHSLVSSSHLCSSEHRQYKPEQALTALVGICAAGAQQPGRRRPREHPRQPLPAARRAQWAQERPAAGESSGSGSRGGGRLSAEGEVGRRVSAAGEGSVRGGRKLSADGEGGRRVSADGEGGRRVSADGEGGRRLSAKGEGGRRLSAEREGSIRGGSRLSAEEAGSCWTPNIVFQLRDSLAKGSR